MRTGNKNTNILKLGIISDTHGLLRPAALDALAGSDMIVHAGDIGKESILDELRSIAPVLAVRGNCDNEGWAYKLNRTEMIKKNSTFLYLIHDINMLDLDPASAKIQILIYGHSHRPSIERHDGTLYINPGSAGPRRFTLPVSVARAFISKKEVDAEIVRLKL